MTNQLFTFAVKNGIVNESELETLYTEVQNRIILEKHFGEGYVLTKGKDGRYFTRLPNGRQIRKADKKEFIDTIVEYYTSATSHSIAEVFYKWIDFKLKYDGIKKGTYDRLEEDYKRFFVNNELAADLMKTDIACITEDDLELFIRDSINKFELTAKGWGKLKSLVSGIWLYAAKLRYTDLYITKFLDVLAIKPKTLRQRVENENEQVFTDEEVKLILDEINRRGYHVTNYGIALCFYTGMRAGELSGLMWSDISPDFRTITVNHTEVLYKGENGIKNAFEVVNHAKTVAGLRKVILPDIAVLYLRELKEHAESSEYVFVKTGKRLHARNFSETLARICVKLDLPPRKMHKIRKTVCSKFCDNGVDDRLLLKQIGHTDRRTTETYYHRDRRTEEEKRIIINSVFTY